MKIKERIQKYFRTKSPLRITTDLLFYLLILSLLIPFSRKFVATGMNKLTMHRPAIIREASQVSLVDGDYEWTLMNIEGTAVSFREFKDEVVFLSIWATWCPPCRAEMPNIQNLFEQYGDRVSFVLASQEAPETILRFMEDHGYTMPVYRLVQNPPSKLSTSSIPTTFLIAPGGKIHVKKTGAARWDGKFFTAYLDDLIVNF
ncbi:MAG: TlpA family protein disulfide reductase [Bacteroidales bacterium]|jgi:thiol-disulfide isomerase/thioredoxin|nr:TlpA family protein disulfide reductase [Bacteroidales bacterium]